MLHSLGYRYRVHLNLPGRPDIAFSRVRLAVFVDGCFWHACPEHGVLPKNNREWWRQKLARNAERDAEKDDALTSLGWNVIHVWEHEDTSAAAKRVADTYERLCRERRVPPPAELTQV
jgi:DNA mismatch endonuclease (patch repair protein)